MTVGHMFEIADGNGNRSGEQGRILFADTVNDKYMVQWCRGSKIAWYRSSWLRHAVKSTWRDCDSTDTSDSIALFMEYMANAMAPSNTTYFVSVDGEGAPTVSHSSIKVAKKEAERLASLLPDTTSKTVRVLQQVAELKSVPVTTYKREWQ